jgi:hypothetical protein
VGGMGGLGGVGRCGVLYCRVVNTILFLLQSRLWMMVKISVFVWLLTIYNLREKVGEGRGRKLRVLSFFLTPPRCLLQVINRVNP